MPISFNIDLTQRRKQQEAQLEKERAQQAIQGITSQLLGAPQAGPPTATGQLSRMNGALPAGIQRSLIESQLTSGVPSMQQAGFTSAQQLLEQERLRQLAAAKSSQIQEATSGIPTTGRPGLESILKLAQIPGQEGEALKALYEQLAPATLSADQQRISGLGGEIAIAPEKAADLEAKRNKQFDQASKIRGEFTGITKPFEDQNQAYGRVIASSQDPSAAGDLALIFNYMKVLDPGSTVREGEFATAAESGGIPDRLRAQYNKVVNGERLSTVQRADFVDRAGRLFEQAAKQHKKTAEEFRNLAIRNNLDPRDVIFQRKTVDVLPSAPPPPGNIKRQVR